MRVFLLVAAAVYANANENNEKPRGPCVCTGSEVLAIREYYWSKEISNGGGRSRLLRSDTTNGYHKGLFDYAKYTGITTAGTTNEYKSTRFFKGLFGAATILPYFGSGSGSNKGCGTKPAGITKPAGTTNGYHKGLFDYAKYTGITTAGTTNGYDEQYKSTRFFNKPQFGAATILPCGTTAGITKPDFALPYTGDFKGTRLFWHTKPAKPTKTKPAGITGVDAKYTGDFKGSGSGSNKGSGTKPAGTKPAKTKPAGTKPAMTKPAGTKPAKTKPAGTKPAKTKPAGTKPAGTKPAKTKPAKTKPAKTKPAGTKPAMTKPAGTKPAGTKPAMTKPAGTKPAGSGGGHGQGQGSEWCGDGPPTMIMDHVFDMRGSNSRRSIQGQKEENHGSACGYAPLEGCSCEAYLRMAIPGYKYGQQCHVESNGLIRQIQCQMHGSKGSGSGGGSHGSKGSGSGGGRNYYNGGRNYYRNSGVTLALNALIGCAVSFLGMLI